MAQGLLHVDGFDDVLNDFNRVVGEIESEAIESLEKSLSLIEERMIVNAKAVFTKGYTEQVMVRSISHKISVKDGIISASVGVYDMSLKTGSSARRIPEPIIAYWYEFGIQPHSTSSGAYTAIAGKRGGRGQAGGLHMGSAPKPFLSSAFDSLSDNIFVELNSHLNKSIDKK